MGKMCDRQFQECYRGKSATAIALAQGMYVKTTIGLFFGCFGWRIG